MAPFYQKPRWGDGGEGGEGPEGGGAAIGIGGAASVDGSHMPVVGGAFAEPGQRLGGAGAVSNPRCASDVILVS
jgi:hypothetical protein